MKKFFTIMAVVAMVIAGNSMYAQNFGEMTPQGMGPGMGPDGPRGMNPEEMIKARVAKLTKTLDLSQEQASKVAAIYKEQMEARRAEREKAMQSGQRPDREAMMQQMKADREQLNAKIEAILTPEQHVKFKEYLDGQQKRGKDRGKRGHGPDGKPGTKR